MASSQEARQRFAEHYLKLAETAEPLLGGPERAAWLQQLEQEQHGMRAALAWAMTPTGDAAVGLRLAGALWWYWFTRSYINEARTWLGEALARGDAPERVRAKALPRAGIVAWFQGEFDQAQAWCAEGLELCRRLGDEHGAAHALHGLGLIAMEHGDPRAAGHFAAYLEIVRRLRDIWGVAWSPSASGTAPGCLRLMTWPTQRRWSRKAGHCSSSWATSWASPMPGSYWVTSR